MKYHTTMVDIHFCILTLLIRTTLSSHSESTKTAKRNLENYIKLFELLPQNDVILDRYAEDTAEVRLNERNNKTVDGSVTGDIIPNIMDVVNFVLSTNQIYPRFRRNIEKRDDSYNEEVLNRRKRSTRPQAYSDYSEDSDDEDDDEDDDDNSEVGNEHFSNFPTFPKLPHKPSPFLASMQKRKHLRQTNAKTDSSLSHTLSQYAGVLQDVKETLDQGINQGVSGMGALKFKPQFRSGKKNEFLPNEMKKAIENTVTNRSKMVEKSIPKELTDLTNKLTQAVVDLIDAFPVKSDDGGDEDKKESKDDKKEKKRKGHKKRN